ncbi:thioredoxin domain-containing protein [Sphingomonas sp. dw_22]|uniref:thioredoxin domain-containing protein n=1 Tax=Sphingomonas sp. dw_22 TaxID=2721175 RepID=UPI002116DBF4|nr:thioredoxin domain-containing protein [Sphingomonas sp. dw_22]
MRRLLIVLAALLALPIAAAPAQKAAAPRWSDVVALTPEGGFRQGNPDAPVKLIEYGSRTCPTCGRFAAEGVAELRDKYVATGKVSYEYRDFLIHGAPDFALALLNQCVPTPRFFAALDAIYANQPAFAARLAQLEKTRSAELEAWQKLPPPQMATRFAEALGFIPFMKAQGVTEARARQCLADPALIKRIAQTNADAVNKQDVDGTPTFIVNGRKVRAFDWLHLQPELWAAGAS